jgi:hypothetical protein
MWADLAKAALTMRSTDMRTNQYPERSPQQHVISSREIAIRALIQISQREAVRVYQRDMGNAQVSVRKEMSSEMPHDLRDSASGLAALSICESLLLAMGDLKIISEAEAINVIADAASAHRDAGGTADQKAMHLAVVTILDRIISGGNSIRHP